MRGDMDVEQRMRLGGRGLVLGGDRGGFVIRDGMPKLVESWGLGRRKKGWAWHLYSLLKIFKQLILMGGWLKHERYFLSASFPWPKTVCKPTQCL